MNRDTVFPIATARSKSSGAKHWRQREITWGELQDWLDDPADHRECGSYVLGTLHQDRPCPDCEAQGRTDCLTRTATTIRSRSALVLDADHPARFLMEKFAEVFPYAYAAHTTYNSAPDAPRYRVIIPLDREVAPDEYWAIAHSVMDLVGADQWDASCAQPARYMFKPSAKHRDWYWSEVQDTEPMPVDEYLTAFDEDLSDVPLPGVNRNKRDPFTLDGVVGAFNRAYPDFQHLIDTYDLPYEPDGAERWHLVGARAAAGMGVVGPGLVFSHHMSDPAAMKACSAFDLVRLHRFSELDDEAPDKTPVNRLPSTLAMMDLAAEDSRVVAELVGLDFVEEIESNPETRSWKLSLNLTPRTGIIKDEITNWDLIRANDPAFQGLVYNEFTLSVEATQDLPWRPLTRGGAIFSRTDRAALCHYLEREYKLRPARSLIDEFVDTIAQQRYVNPVRDYLEGLVWDGVPRLETCLPGVVPTDYTRMVARKSLVAAVGRIFEPGCKWDHTMVLYGEEGIGKSYWVDQMARGYSATLGRLGDKDTLIIMQRSWIMLADEGYSLRKADADVMKEFLTRREDVFRLPYEREASAHPRHCVIWGSTNDEVFLRRQEGNRRFLIVRCTDKVNFDALTEDYVNQVWAEAVALYRAGEKLYLDDVQSTVAALEREQFTEEDALVGIIEHYLDTLVPDGWAGMSLESRQTWLANAADGMSKGTEPIQHVCSSQVWVEALGKRLGDARRQDLLEINTALKRIPGWTQLPGRQRQPHYGPQVVFTRTPSIKAVLDELI